MTLRDKRQKEFATIWLERGKFGILNLCPRFGKCRVGILALREVIPKRVLIAYPDLKIKKSWEDEFEAMSYRPPEVVFTTFRSLFKHEDEKFDVVILDEVHLLSENNISTCRNLFKNNPRVLGLTGSMSSFTEKDLREQLKLRTLAVYPIETAIKENVIVDYRIFIHKTKLDNVVLQKFGKKVRTEKSHFNAYSWIINKKEEKGEDTGFLRLTRARILSSSLGKVYTTKKILKEFSSSRVLVFCGTIKVSESLEIPAFHSESEDKEIFERFASGEISKLAVVKIGNLGVTYKPLECVILNYFDSNVENMIQKINRCMGMEYDNPDKIAQIHIITTDEEVELNWLERCLKSFDKDKIFWI